MDTSYKCFQHLLLNDVHTMFFFNPLDKQEFSLYNIFVEVYNKIYNIGSIRNVIGRAFIQSVFPRLRRKNTVNFPLNAADDILCCDGFICYYVKFGLYI